MPLAGGQKLEFNVDCSDGQLVVANVEQKGIDVGLRVAGPDGTAKYEFDGDPRDNGSEPAEFLCANGARTTLTIEPRQRGAKPGEIAVTLVDVRPATDKDKALDEARLSLIAATRLWRAAKYTDALPLSMKSLEIRERELGAGHPDVGLSLFTVANIYSDLPDIPQAKAYYRRAIDNRSKALGPDHYSLASIHNNLGVLHKDQGEYPEAIDNYERAAAIRSKALHPEHLLVASVLNNIAGIHRARGDESRASELYARVLAIREKALGPDHPDVATALSNAVDQSWPLVKAEPYYLRALAVREAKLRPDHPDIAQNLYNLALLYAGEGQFDRAEPLNDRSLAIFRKTLGDAHYFVSYPLNLSAVIAKGKGDFPRAERLFEETISLKERTQGAYHPHLGGTLANAANLYSILGKSDKAHAALERSNAIFEYNIRLNMYAGSESQKLKYIELMSIVGDLAITLNSEKGTLDPRLARLAFGSVLQRKGRVLDSMSDTVRSMRAALDESDKKLLEEWNNANARIAKLAVGGPGDLKPEEYRAKLGEAERERDRIELRLGIRGRRFLDLSASPKVESIAANLAPDTALVEFAVHRPVVRRLFELAEHIDTARSLDKPRYVAFVLRRGGKLSSVDLGDAARLDAELERYRRALRSPAGGHDLAGARAAANRIFLPLKNAIGDATKLIISPDGDLNLVPFEPLVDTDGKFLVEKYEIGYIATARDLVKRQDSVPVSEPLLIANPEFGLPSGTSAALRSRVPRRTIANARSLNDTIFAPLSGTVAEVRSIKSLYPAAKLLSGDAASESALKQAKAPAFLHIATHGFFLEESISPMGEAKAPSGASHPLLRSGLALAGANRREAEDGSDGIFTALEATGLDLNGTKLVVLSACDTGVGEVRTGEGVYGLRRAFQLAGAESLVMSLWPVRDDATRELMAGYYRNLKNGLGRGESLRQAQLALLKRPDRRHPFYWAAFIQSGESSPLSTTP